MAGESRKKRTIHGGQRHREKTRPTDMAFYDRDHPEEVYTQVEDGRMIYVGKRRCVHVFEKDAHLTSSRMSRREREAKAKQGQWRRVY